MDLIKKMTLWVDEHPLAYYTLLVVVLLGFNIFVRWRHGDPWTDTFIFSIVNTAILAAGLIWGDSQRRKALENKKKINEYLKNKENNEL